ncbi:MAG: phosphate ABC transporter permease subunit PstC [Candidatus Manganitrophus sp.]|nr:MAG: phosphate ABC transporter permease subunit PstC [Candidatus Manganitrophus sp.]
MEGGLLLSALLSVFITLGIIGVLLFETLSFFGEVSIIDFLTDTQWTPLFAEKHFGILPLFAGTFLTTAIAMAVSLPIGLISAIYLSEYASDRVRTTIKPFLEILAAVPTVVYGYFALLFVTPLLQKFFPELSGFNALSPGIVMGIMIIPIISSLSEDAMHAVPLGLREGGYALGSTRLQVALRVVLPAAFSGVAASFILGISRAVGENNDRGGRRRTPAEADPQPLRSDRDGHRLHRPGQHGRHPLRDHRIQNHLRRGDEPFCRDLRFKHDQLFAPKTF